MDNRTESKGLSSLGGCLEGHLGGSFNPKAESGLFREDYFQAVYSFTRDQMNLLTEQNKFTGLPALSKNFSQAKRCLGKNH
jgi:hypothetical protein